MLFVDSGYFLPVLSKTERSLESRIWQNALDASKGKVGESMVLEVLQIQLDWTGSQQSRRHSIASQKGVISSAAAGCQQNGMTPKPLL
jgi:hypothetical protein